MSRFVNGVVLGVFVFVLVLAAYFYAEEFDGPERIRAERVDSEWGTVDAASTEIRTTVLFENPHRTQAQLAKLDYEVLIDGERLDGGTRHDALWVPAGGNTTLSFSTQFATSFIVEWLETYARGGGQTSELIVRGSAEFSVGGQNVAVPFGSQSAFQSSLLGALQEGVGNCQPEPQALCLLSGEPQWVTTTNGSSGVKLLITLRNPDTRDVELRELQSGILLEGTPVAQGFTPGPISVATRSDREAEILMVFDERELETWWPRHVSQCERSTTQLNMEFTLQQSLGDGNESGSSTAVVEWQMPGTSYMTQFLCSPENANDNSSAANPQSTQAATAGNPVLAAGFPLGWGGTALPEIARAVGLQLPSNEFLRTLMGNAALLLIVGGLAVLGLIVLLLLLQSLFPARLAPSDREPEALRPQLRPLGAHAPAPEMSALSRRLKSGTRTRRPVVDQALDQILQLRVGEPRLLRHRPHYSLVRVYECNSCETAPARPDFRGRVEGCPFERAAVENAFQGTYGEHALVRETACRRWGDLACEYEVRH